MTLRHTVYTSALEIPSEEWDRVIGESSELTMDRRLIAAMETSMSGAYPFFTIVVHDDSGCAQAIACNWLLRIDLMDYPWLRRLVTILPAKARNWFKVGVLFCGLPQPAGQNQLCFAAGADRAAVIAEITRALRQLARQQSASLVVIKEFKQAESDELKKFAGHGFLRCEIPPLHRLERPFASFEDYLASLKSRYRSQVNRSLKKFAAEGFRIEQVYGPDDVCRVMTDSAHELYHAVWERSDYKLEYLPAEFTREIARRFGRDASLTCAWLDQKLVGFTLGIMGRDMYYNVISGLDYELNNRGDVYFNLFYHDMDFAWKRGAKKIDLGLTSDDFKSRLGTHIEPLYLYVDMTRRMLSWGLKAASPWAFPKLKPVQPHHVFKDSPDAEPKSAKASRAVKTQ